MLVDEFLPVSDVSDAVAAVVDADLHFNDVGRAHGGPLHRGLGSGPNSHHQVTSARDDAPCGRTRATENPC
jgi:hypothetical protein